MAPKPKAQRRRTLPEQDTLTQMMRKARGKISSPPPPPDRKTFAQFLEDSFAGNLLDNDFAISFTQGLREVTNQSCDWLQPLLQKFFRSASTPRGSLSKIYSPRSMAQMVKPSKFSRSVGEWLLAATQRSREDSGQETAQCAKRRQLMVVGGGHSGKSTAVRAAAGSFDIAMIEVSHLKDPLVHFKETKENTHSQTVVRGVGDRFSKKIQLIKNLDELMALAADKRNLLAEMKRYFRQSRIPFVCTSRNSVLGSELEFDCIELPPPDSEDFAPFFYAVYKLECNFKKYRTLARQSYQDEPDEQLNARLVEFLDSGVDLSHIRLMAQLIQVLNYDLVQVFTSIQHQHHLGLPAILQLALNERGWLTLAHNKKYHFYSLAPSLFLEQLVADGRADKTTNYQRLQLLQLCCAIDQSETEVQFLTGQTLSSALAEKVLDKLVSHCKLMYLSKAAFLQEEKVRVLERIGRRLQCSYAEFAGLKGCARSRAFELIQLLEVVGRKGQEGRTRGARSRARSQTCRVISHQQLSLLSSRSLTRLRSN